jgi:hypothetical protein
MTLAEPAPPAAAPALPAGLPPGAVPAGSIAMPASPPPDAGAADGTPYVVEQRVVGTEVHTRHMDQPDPGPAVPLLEALPAGMVDGARLPLPYRLSESATGPRMTLRVADSPPARARGYTCVPFYKPISRCVAGRL